MSDMAEFDDLRLELQKLKKKKQSLEVLGKVKQSTEIAPFFWVSLNSTAAIHSSCFKNV